MPLKISKSLILRIGLFTSLMMMTIFLWSSAFSTSSSAAAAMLVMDSQSPFTETSQDMQSHPTEALVLAAADRIARSSDSTAIPKIILQTHIDKTLIPYEVYHNVQKFAPGYDHILLNDDEALEFLEHYFHPAVKERFLRFSNGAHKADILRYALLYIYGGVYLDIKTELIKPLDELLTERDAIYSVISSVPNSIYQGIIATPPQKRLFLDLIRFMIESDNPTPESYLKFTNDFYFRVKKDVLDGSRTNLSEGLNFGAQNRYFLFQEVCSTISTDCYDGLDRYGVCCFATLKGERVIKIRRSSYPWFKNRLGKKLVGPLIFHTEE